MIPKKQKNYTTTRYALSEEDFKNIYARLWVKYWKTVLLTIFALLTGGYILINKIATDTVEKILTDELVKSQFYDYRNKLLDSANKDIHQIKQQVISEMKNYHSLPYNIENNKIIFFDSSGKFVNIQYGSATTADTVYFKKQFKTIPVLITTIDNSKHNKKEITNAFGIKIDQDPYYGHIIFRRTLQISYIDKRRFVVYYGLSKTLDKEQLKFNWIAIGE